MSIAFDRVGNEVYETVNRMMEKFHTELHGAEVTVQCLFARNDDDEQPAVKSPGGVPAYAVIRRVPLKQRVAGFRDAEITIDERKWENLTEAQREALIDHELEHLELVYEGDGPGTPVELDDWGRPKLKLRQHDWDLAGFESIARRHPDAAMEVLQARAVEQRFGAMLFGGVEVG